MLQIMVEPRIRIKRAVVKKLLSGENIFSSLHGGKHYQIKGNANIPSSWWSITLYNEKDFLHKNSDNRFSFSNFNVKTKADGTFVIDINPTRPSGSKNWLPSPQNEAFNLKLRIYEPKPELYDNIATFKLPKVTEVEAI